jgi:YVTN family beta-propeller protein
MMSIIALMQEPIEATRCALFGLSRASRSQPASHGRSLARQAAKLALVIGGSVVIPSSVPTLAETTIGSTIQVGTGPAGAAVNTSTGRVYITNFNGGSVSVIDGATDTVIGSPITVASQVRGIAVNPITNRIYVTSRDTKTVRVIDGASGTLVGQPIPVGEDPVGAAVNPTTNRVYVTNEGGKSVTVIDGATGTAMGQPIEVGVGPFGVAVNPATNRVYVANQSDSTVSVIDGATGTVMGQPIAVTGNPIGVAVNPATNRVYTANGTNSTVSVIDGANNTVIGSPIPVGTNVLPFTIDVNPATNRVYVGNVLGGNVVTIDGATNTVLGSPITVGSQPQGIVVHPATNRVYAANAGGNSVSVIGIPLSVSASTVASGGLAPVTWSSLAGPNGGDFVGLFQPGTANSSPVSRRFTNGSDAPGGNGAEAGTVALPIPAGQSSGTYEIRLVSGLSGGTLARAGVAVASAPVAANDTFTTASDRVLASAAPGVLTNDSDADSPDLKATLETDPAHGTLILQSSGAFTYTPVIGYAGADSFAYRATDPTGLSTTATVAITVAAPPVAANDTYTVANGSTLTIAAPGLLANDADLDSPTLQVAVVSGPAHGTLAPQASGGFAYTPRPDFAGSDRFTYRATDQTGLSSTATVFITVNAVACGPRPSVHVQSAVANGALQVTVSASDVGGPTQNELRELRFAAPANGRITLNGQAQTGAFTHTPPAGTPSVTFSVQRVTPGQATTVPLTVVDRCGTWPTFVGGGANSSF